MPHSPASACSTRVVELAIASLVQEGLVEAFVRPDGEVGYRLTEAGKAATEPRVLERSLATRSTA